MRHFRLIAALFAAAAVVFTASAEASTDRRVALVIGNGAYKHAASLKNPVSDARAMADKLRTLGFTVVEGYDVDFAQMNTTLLNFAREVRQSDLSVFFYAGHGVAHAGSNYLIPVDAHFRDARNLDLEAVRADLITNQMQYSDGVNLVFLDACRDNPLNDPQILATTAATRSLAVERGLTNMSAATGGKGLAIAFATSPGQVAQDGAGEHSPFTTALLRHIGKPNLDITSAMSLVTGDVLTMTNDQQRPWLNTSLTGRVFLNPVVEPAPAIAAAPADISSATPVEIASADPAEVSRAIPSGVGGVTSRALPSAAAPAPSTTTDTRTVSLEAQELLWKYAEKSGKVADYRNYLQTFPNGLFAPLATSRIADLGTQVAAVTPPSASPLGSAPAISATTTTPQVAPPAAPPVFDTGPLSLDVTAAVKAAPATAETEKALLMDREKSREVQHRLNLAGYDVGYADGLFGRKTRTGISGFQADKGLPQTGYLNALQLQILTVDTATALEADPVAAPVQTVSRTPERTSRAAKAPTRSTSTTRSVKRTTTKSTSRKRTVTRRTTTRRSGRVVARRPVSRGQSVSPAAAAFAGAVVGGVVGGLLAR